MALSKDSQTRKQKYDTPNKNRYENEIDQQQKKNPYRFPFFFFVYFKRIEKDRAPSTAKAATIRSGTRDN